MTPNSNQPPRAKRRGKHLVLFAAGLLVGIGLLGGTVVLAQQNGPEKRAVQPDLPGPAFSLEPLPVGTPYAASAGAVIHGQFEVVPAGKMSTRNTHITGPRATWVYTNKTLTTLSDIPPGPLSITPKLPPGYKFSGGGAIIGTDANGVSEATELHLNYDNGVNYPIRITVWRPPEYARGEPYQIAAPDDQSLSTVTLGSVAGTSAVFVHRRPGVEGADVQEIYLADGEIQTLVEGYVQRFGTLLDVAESIAGAK